jgi:hypothetical protein
VRVLEWFCLESILVWFTRAGWGVAGVFLPGKAPVSFRVLAANAPGEFTESRAAAIARISCAESIIPSLCERDSGDESM